MKRFFLKYPSKSSFCIQNLQRKIDVFNSIKKGYYKMVKKEKHSPSYGDYTLYFSYIREPETIIKSRIINQLCQMKY